MLGFSTRFIFSAFGVVLLVFGVLYGVHKFTSGASDPEAKDSELTDNRPMRRTIGQGASRGNGGRHSAGEASMKVKTADEQVIMNVAATARLAMAEQQRAQREKMAPLMKKRREFLASLETVEDEEERKRLRGEWFKKQRSEMMESRQAQDSESARASQRLASLEGKLHRLRRYELVPELKPQADEIKSLMAQYSRQYGESELANNQALWTQIEQGIQNLRMQHQKLIHPERFRE